MWGKIERQAAFSEEAYGSGTPLNMRILYRKKGIRKIAQKEKIFQENFLFADYFLSFISFPFCNSISYPLVNIQSCSATFFRIFSCCLKCQFHKESGANREHCL